QSNEEGELKAKGGEIEKLSQERLKEKGEAENSDTKAKILEQEEEIAKLREKTLVDEKKIENLNNSLKEKSNLVKKTASDARDVQKQLSEAKLEAKKLAKENALLKKQLEISGAKENVQLSVGF
ncbi:MAG: hypothetical protein ACXU9U_03070, partial [Parachlamydiaceae bacterium]